MLIPIVLIMFFMGLVRNNVTQLLRKDVPAKREQVQQNNQLMRALRARMHSTFQSRRSRLANNSLSTRTTACSCRKWRRLIP